MFINIFYKKQVREVIYETFHVFTRKDYEFISKRFHIPYISFIITTKTATTIPHQVQPTSCQWLGSLPACSGSGVNETKALGRLRVRDNNVFVSSVLVKPLNPELNPICYLLALLAHHFLHVSRIMVKSLLTLRLLMSYIYGAHILDVSRSHTTTQHSR